MKVQISIKEINSSFSQDYADEYQFGEESVDNMKYNWTESFMLEVEVDNVNIKKKQTVHYIGDDNVNLILEEITIIQFIKKDELLYQFAISDDLMAYTHNVFKENEDTHYYNFYLKDNMKYEIIGEDNYILKTDIVHIT